MLPHPTDWSKEIRQNVSQKLQEIKKLYGPDTKITPEISRLASALAATNEVNLYPYTFDRFERHEICCQCFHRVRDTWISV